MASLISGDWKETGAMWKGAGWKGGAMHENNERKMVSALLSIADELKQIRKLMEQILIDQTPRQNPPQPPERRRP